ncbi:MAG: hypothetical protein IPK85_21160 [Gemmatimonadetes bacterium]|nr:hypothetical protein [Gemmatimonadota bacterium]
MTGPRSGWENIRNERFRSLGLQCGAQHQSDVTSVLLPGAIMPFGDTTTPTWGCACACSDPSRTPRRAVEEA